MAFIHCTWSTAGQWIFKQNRGTGKMRIGAWEPLISYQGIKSFNPSLLPEGPAKTVARGTGQHRIQLTSFCRRKRFCLGKFSYFRTSCFHCCTVFGFISIQICYWCCMRLFLVRSCFSLQLPWRRKNRPDACRCSKCCWSVFCEYGFFNLSGIPWAGWKEQPAW